MLHALLSASLISSAAMAISFLDVRKAFTSGGYELESNTVYARRKGIDLGVERHLPLRGRGGRWLSELSL